MKIITAFAVGLALAGVLSAAPAQAQNQHSFVSSQGNDANACTLAAPCRHLQAALTATLAGGEIAVLDTAGYNGGTTVTITQAVSIVNPGGFEAAIAPPSGGRGIIINAGTNDAVSLRGLSIDGAGVGLHGIQFNSGASLTVENCVIRHMTGDGIIFLSSTATSALTVSNSLVADNASSGIILLPTGSATAVFNRVEANNNGIGIIVIGSSSPGTNTVNATVSDSVASGNFSDGFFSQTATSQAPTMLTVFNSVAANNGTGVEADGTGAIATVKHSVVSNNQNGVTSNPGAVVVLAQSEVTGNSATGALLNGGPIYSYGDNNIDKNVTNDVAGGALTPLMTR